MNEKVRRLADIEVLSDRLRSIGADCQVMAGCQDHAELLVWSGVAQMELLDTTVEMAHRLALDEKGKDGDEA